MKQVIILLIGISMSLTGLAQTDSTQTESDTIRVGGMIIVKKRNKNNDGEAKTYNRKKKPSRVSTNWWIVDLGFANYNDQTDYKSAGMQNPTDGFAPGLDKDDFKLRTGKSVNVNIWAFMQRVNVIKGVINLKYGLGIELNNYRYREPILFSTNPTKVTYDLSRGYSKNKLAADYVTVPLMVNFNFAPHRHNAFGLSLGASAGYLYSSRQKIVTDIDGKHKERDDFDLEPWKLSYIGEILLGPVKLYGSYAAKSMFERGPDQRPYNFGIRLSNW